MEEQEEEARNLSDKITIRKGGDYEGRKRRSIENAENKER